MSVELNDRQVAWFRDSIDLMNSIYDDKSRDEFWEADDIARSIADELDAILREQGHGA